MNILKMFSKTQPKETTGLLPLDEIRQEEAKITSQVIQARQQAEAIRAAARQQAEELKSRAAADGARDGQNARAKRYAEAQDQASEIVLQARQQAEGFAVQTGDQINAAVDWAENLVFGFEQKGSRDES